MKHTTIFRSACSVVILGCAALLVAGPLDPPAGPVTSSYKTITEVEPRIAVNATNTPGDADSLYRITQPGSYYLVGSLVGMPAKDGIEIASDNVELDLGGFTLTGTSGSLAGVSVEGAFSSVHVRQGTIAAWDGGGVTAASLRGGSIRNVTCLDSTAIGFLLGSGLSVLDCRASGTATGFFCVGPNRLVSCDSSSNGAGFVVGGGVVERCVARGNTVDGFLLAQVGANDIPGNAFMHCTSDSNGASGFRAEPGAGPASFMGCVATSCGTRGFDLGAGSIATGCVTRDCAGVGFFGGAGSRFEGCSAMSTSIGFQVGAGSEVRRCITRASVSRGIDAADRCTIAENTVTDSTQDGIRVAGDCRVTANLCSGNGAGAGSGAGILATGIDNHIDGNTCTDADRGVECTTFGNYIVRNTCSGNTSNWNLAADNHYGSIVNITAVPAPAVTGLGGAATVLASTDPHANFSY